MNDMNNAEQLHEALQNELSFQDVVSLTKAFKPEILKDKLVLLIEEHTLVGKDTLTLEKNLLLVESITHYGER